MTWTRRTPTARGYYWLKPVGRDYVTLAVVFETDDGLRVKTMSPSHTGSAGVIDPLSDRYGLWFGPIQPPELP